MNVEFHPEGFVNQLQYMGLGMLAIVIVMGAIILVTMLLNRVTGSKTSSSAKKGICVGGVVVALVLAFVLVITDGSCVVCRKNGEHELCDKSYCEEHYEEAWKTYLEEVENSCDACGEKGEYELEGKKYCEDHYEEVWKEYFKEHVDDLKK